MVEISLSGRDLALVRHVSHFRQATPRQLRSLYFESIQSATPLYRALQRLTRDKYLHRIERRSIGGAYGGAGQYVYCLGRRGFYMQNTGRFDPSRSINYHALALGDCFVTIKQLEQASIIRLVGYAVEPTLHIASYRLDPDMQIETVRRDDTHQQFLLEVDMGTEGQRQIKDTLTDYWRAYQASSDTEWPDSRLVVWAATDEERETELRWLISQGPPEAGDLFVVTTISKLANLFLM